MSSWCYHLTGAAQTASQPAAPLPPPAAHLLPTLHIPAPAYHPHHPCQQTQNKTPDTPTWCPGRSVSCRSDSRSACTRDPFNADRRRQAPQTSNKTTTATHLVSRQVCQLLLRQPVSHHLPSPLQQHQHSLRGLPRVCWQLNSLGRIHART
jgi:hypothetical protein